MRALRLHVSLLYGTGNKCRAVLQHEAHDLDMHGTLRAIDACARGVSRQPAAAFLAATAVPLWSVTVQLPYPRGL